MNEKVNKKLLKASGICAVIMVVALIIIGILELCVMGFSSKLEFLKAGEKWAVGSDEEKQRYAVISMYTEEGSAFSADQARSWAIAVDNALVESSITPKEGARSWAYFFAAQDTITVLGPKGNTNAEVMAVGGDFFTFHDMKFTFGSAFLNDDSNPRGIVIDRDLAWKVFGAENIIGMTVEIGGIEFTVVGVCEPESKSGIYGYTYGTRPRMYMNYAGYEQATGKSGNCTIFESALPNSVKGFARNIFDKTIKVNEETSSVFEASDRFSLINRYNNMKTLKYSWIRENRIAYPYWENEAKVYDYYCAIIMIFEVAFAAVFVVTLLLSLVMVRFSEYSLFYDIKKLFKNYAAKNIKHKKRKRVTRKKVRKPTFNDNETI